MSYFWHFDYHNLESTLRNLIVGDGYNTKFLKIDTTHFHLWTTKSLQKSSSALVYNTPPPPASPLISHIYPDCVKRCTYFFLFSFHMDLFISGFYISSSYFLFLSWTIRTILFWLKHFLKSWFLFLDSFSVCERSKKNWRFFITM